MGNLILYKEKKVAPLDLLSPLYPSNRKEYQAFKSENFTNDLRDGKKVLQSISLSIRILIIESTCIIEIYDLSVGCGAILHNVV
tara:strand:- start:244 stop:495 length:252 start_codon:yes stop_codon:yes gene_type:complete